MPLDPKIQEQINRLSLESSYSTGLTLTKVQTSPGVGNLIVSTGGSGADMLLETKGLITQCCCDDYDMKKAPQRVVYLSFDTDSTYENHTSSEKTGSVPYSPNELEILKQGGFGALLNPTLRDHMMGKYPEIYSWLDTRIQLPSDGSGAGGCRQVGRGILFLNIDRVYRSMKAALTKLLSGGNVGSLNIYLLSGISGGTGSGTFLDMAYLLRKAAKEVLGNGQFAMGLNGIHIFGFLLMPDVNLLNADARTAPNVRLNGGAALQELDYAMKIRSANDYFHCTYSSAYNIEVNTQEPPFDYVHLICANASGGPQTVNPYARCLDVVANSILSFVAGEKTSDGAAGGAAAAKNQFPVESYYSNIATMQLNAENQYPERQNVYISMGVATWEIPMEQLIRYVFTLMFKNVDKLFLNQPSQSDVDGIYRALRIDWEDQLEDMEADYSNPLRASEFTWDELFGNAPLPLQDYLGLQDKMERARQNLETNMRNFPNLVHRTLGEKFTDADLGPIWVNHVMVTVGSGYKGVDKLLNESFQDAINRRAELLKRLDSTLNEIELLRAGKRGFLQSKADYINAYIARWNEYARLQLDIYCLDLLIKDEMYQNSKAGYTTMTNYLVSINNSWLDTTKEILDSLSKVVEGNNTGIKSKTVAHGKGFTWKVNDIPNLDKILAGMLVAAGIKDDVLMADFLKKLLANADEWTSAGVNVTAFVDEFLKSEANGIVNVSMEGILAAAFGGGDLADSVEHELLPELGKKATPLFMGTAGIKESECCNFLSVPAGCTAIINGTKAFKGTKSNYNISTSYLRNRISYVSTLIGISLCDYLPYQACEEELAKNPNSYGLFLYQATEDRAIAPSNWMEMPLPTVIPRRMRLTTTPAPERFKKFEDNRLVDLKTLRKGKYPCLRMERTTDGQDYNLYLYRSKRLVDTDYYSISKPENYIDESGKIDRNALQKLIARLEAYRKNGLPGVDGDPKKFRICENLLHQQTEEMKHQTDNKLPEEVEGIKLENAWEVASWFYLSCYSFYMTAMDEMKKYDEVEEKIQELEGIQDGLEKRPKRMLQMAKMLALGIVYYEPRTTTFYYKNKRTAGEIKLLELHDKYRYVLEKKLYEHLEKMRLSSGMDKQVYDRDLAGVVQTDFDDKVAALRRNAPAQSDDFYSLYEKMEDKRRQYLKKRDDLDKKVHDRYFRNTEVENEEVLDFYETLYQALDDDLHGSLGTLSGAKALFDELLRQSKPEESKPEPKPVDDGSWTCGCGTKNTGKFCSNCGKSKPESWTCGCGTKNTGKFCSNCGKSKPESWTCSCGTKNTGKFCSNCGKPKPVDDGSWTCSCGAKNTGNFCSVCGKPQPSGKGKTCRMCGQKFEDPVPAFCPTCGEKL